MNSSKLEDNLSVALSSFWEEMVPKVDAHAIPIVLERIQEWVGEQPEMTKALCDYVIQYAAQIDEGDAEAIVDLIVQKEIVENWQNSLAAPHLNKIKSALLDYSRSDSLLISYIQILQQGKITPNNSPEQAVLLRSGLAKMNRGKLEVDNDLYAKVFSLEWVEQQLPGITKPVVIVSTAANGRFSASSRLYSKLAIAVCGLAVLGAAISFYTKEPSSQVMATPNAIQKSEVPNSAVDSVSLGSQSTDAGVNNEAKAADRALFDDGEEHAKNSRWVPMMRDFCSLSAESSYFAPAEKRLEQWAGLYQEDIQMASDIVTKEKGDTCSIAQDALDAAAVK